MKLIQRYSRYARASTAAAGVYIMTTAAGFTQAGFQIIINSLHCGFSANDLTTRQGINANFRIDTNISPNFDNPGFLNSGNFSSELGGRTSDEVFQPFNYVSPPSNVFTFDLSAFLESVTANIISGQWWFTIGYLCPEDYLSVEAFAAKP